MFLLRSVSLEDLSDLIKLSRLGIFISLPRNEKMLKKIVESSIKSFKDPDPAIEKNNYLFVLEDLDKNEVIGASLIHAQHGTEQEPHFYLRVSQEHKYSKSLNTGFVHGILKLGHETNGPTEIGGLVLQPLYRNHSEKLGKQLSFVRFLYMGIYPERFKEEVHCELLPPFDEKGNSPLWEAIGRRFMNMEYHEADLLSRQNKEFILSLYPANTIYVTLLPLEARNAIGKVGPDTLPVKKMLESVGFKYINEVDPFDGGPHYRCLLKDIIPIKEKITGIILSNKKFDKQLARKCLIQLNNHEFDFAAICCEVNVDRENSTSLIIDSALKKHFPFTENQKTHAIFL